MTYKPQILLGSNIEATYSTNNRGACIQTRQDYHSIIENANFKIYHSSFQNSLITSN